MQTFVPAAGPSVQLLPAWQSSSLVQMRLHATESFAEGTCCQPLGHLGPPNWNESGFATVAPLGIGAATGAAGAGASGRHTLAPGCSAPAARQS
jgi:hypothetical protein